jgi:hypothetical protein
MDGPAQGEKPVFPYLFDNFVECRTRGQRRQAIVILAKRAVKWILNWNGARNSR